MWRRSATDSPSVRRPLAAAAGVLAAGVAIAMWVLTHQTILILIALGAGYRAGRRSQEDKQRLRHRRPDLPGADDVYFEQARRASLEPLRDRYRRGTVEIAGVTRPLKQLSAPRHFVELGLADKVILAPWHLTRPRLTRRHGGRKPNLRAITPNRRHDRALAHSGRSGKHRQPLRHPGETPARDRRVRLCGIA